MAAVDTPYEDRITWSHHHGRISEGKSPLGRHVFTQNEDGTLGGFSSVQTAWRTWASG
jgi:hypothetical protein